MTIVTQENDLINFNAIKFISTYAAHVGTADDEVEVYVLFAFDLNADFPISNEADEELQSRALQLGVFTSEDECNNVISSLLSAIKADLKVFVIPQPSESGVDK